ncbi:mavicyanin-like [Tasmannia lanceolata]|uniref:mavicyanin-like n=1 Tax=Tasmannia lanceolata TaxID=3420 RepID=UPI004062DD45
MVLQCRTAGVALVVVLFVLGTVLETSQASKTTTSREITVGGSEHWRLGFNYIDWVSKAGPFYVNDTLVFMYEPPGVTNFTHSVYLLKDFWTFRACDLKTGKLLANESQGGGEGFKFLLKEANPYFFACGMPTHCSKGQKFAFWPLPFNG